MTETGGNFEMKAQSKRGVAAALVLASVLAVAGLWLASPTPATQDRGLWSWLGAGTHRPGAPSSSGFEDIVERVKPAVFGVRAKVVEETVDLGSLLPQLGEEPGQSREDASPRPTTSQGSGFFISSDGYAITTNHVIEHGTSIEIETAEGQKYPAKVVGSDPETDLALLKVDGDSSFSFVEIADRMPRIGEWVIAVGNPFGLGGTVTAGIVSAHARDITPEGYSDFIQIDAPVNQGNSGGPSFDVAGRVIGVNSAIVSPTGGSVGIGFAIPAETVKAVAADLRTKGKVTRAWIGVRIQSITPELAEGLALAETHGALVSEPQPHSPAAKVGIRSGDVIAFLNGQPLKDDRDLAKKVGDMAPGTQVELGIVRQGESKTVTVRLGQLPSKSGLPAPAEEKVERGETAPDPSSLGITLVPGTQISAETKGVLVSKVDPSGIAAERGLQVGDLILDVAGMAVKEPSDVQKALSEAHDNSKRNVVARVRSGESTRFVAIPVG